MTDIKVAVVIYESVSTGNARVYRGLSTALEFKRAGDEVVVMFDGSGVESLAAISDSSHKMNPLLEELKDNVIGACDLCARSHRAIKPIKDAGWALLDENNGEASVRKFVVEGYQILNF